MLPNSPASPLESRLRAACADLERQLRAGEACRAEEFLPHLATDDDAAVELIYTEFATRHQLGQTPVTDEYLQRFPNWRDRLTRLFEIHRLFAPDGHTVTEWHGETPFPSQIGGIRSEDRRSASGTLGRFEILGELGRGAMGVVYSARQIGLDRTVALKVVPLAASDAQPVSGGPIVNRFANEARALASLQHPNIVQVFDIGVDGLTGHLAMELVECGNLTRKLAAGVPHVKWSAELMIQLAGAVAYAHARGVTHRDLKPANILLTAAGEPKIADFGLAKCCATDGGQTTTGAIVGTPSYMAPEQAAGETNIGPAADVYSLGAILYELLTGVPPFVGGSMLETLRLVLESEPAAPRQHRSQVPRAIETICLKCLEKDPCRRYSSADALAEDLRRFLAGAPILAVRTGRTRRFWSWCRRKPVIAGLAAALLVSVVGGFALVTWQWQRADQQRQTAERGWTEADRQRGEAEWQRIEADVQRAAAAASLRQAHDAVHTYFTLVSDSTLLDTPGMQPLRSQLLQSALDHYLRFQKSGGDSPALRVEIAASYFRVAQLHHLNDRNDDSIAALRRGTDLADEMLRNPPYDAGFPHRLAGLLTGSGRRLHRYTKPPKDAAAAGATLVKAIRLWEDFAVRWPQIPEFRVDVATLSCLFGELLDDQGQHAEAEKWLGRAKAQWPPLLAERPTAAEWQVEHGRVTLALGDARRSLGQDKAAEAAFLEAIALFQKLADGPSRAPHHRALLATATYHLGLMYNATSRRTEADARFADAAGVFERLISEYPHLSSAREGAASVHITRGELLLERGETPRAREAVNKALALLEQLQAEYPGKTAYRRRLASAQALLAKLP